MSLWFLLNSLSVCWILDWSDLELFALAFVCLLFAFTLCCLFYYDCVLALIAFLIGLFSVVSWFVCGCLGIVCFGFDIVIVWLLTAGCFGCCLWCLFVFAVVWLLIGGLVWFSSCLFWLWLLCVYCLLTALRVCGCLAWLGCGCLWVVFCCWFVLFVWLFCWVLLVLIYVLLLTCYFVV